MFYKLPDASAEFDNIFGMVHVDLQSLYWLFAKFLSLYHRLVLNFYFNSKENYLVIITFVSVTVNFR